MRKILIVFTAFGVLSACSHELEELEAPETLIPVDTMEMVLLDVMLLEAHMRSISNNVHDFYQIMLKSSQPIFEKYGVDSLRYVESMDYYARRQEELKALYERIQDTITLRAVRNQEELRDTVGEKL
jgi:hypothetical protein